MFKAKDKIYFKELIKETTIKLAFEYNIDEEIAMNIIANLISHEAMNDYRQVEYLGRLFNKASGYDAIAINCELRYIRNQIMNEIYSR
jgi:hypothetical protein